MHRKRLLQSIAAAGFVLASGTGARAAVAPAEAPRRPVEVRLGYVGLPCEAATVMAPRGASFLRRALHPRLVAYASDAALIAALDKGTVDAASVRLPILLEPLQAGVNVRVTAGLHAGCLRVLAPESVGIASFGDLVADLKGAHIATDRLNGPAMNLLTALLRGRGVDPQRDVTWNVYTAPDLEAALDAKTVTCVATSDPLGYALIADHVVAPYLETAGGGFSCGGDIAPGHHCFLAVHGGLVQTSPATAARLTRAYLEATAAIGRGVGPAAVAEADGPFPADLRETLGMLSSYDWRASTDFVTQELELTARDFRRAGLLLAATDPQQLAQRAFADVLHA